LIKIEVPDPVELIWTVTPWLSRLAMMLLLASVLVEETVCHPPCPSAST
jgi:hypothetical protein